MPSQYTTLSQRSYAFDRIDYDRSSGLEPYTFRPQHSPDSPPDLPMSDVSSPTKPISIASTRVHSRRPTDESMRNGSPPQSSYSGSYLSGSQYLETARRAASPLLGSSFPLPGQGASLMGRDRDGAGRGMSGGQVQPYQSGYAARRGSIGDFGGRYQRARSPLSDEAGYPLPTSGIIGYYDGKPLVPPTRYAHIQHIHSLLY